MVERSLEEIKAFRRSLCERGMTTNGGLNCPKHGGYIGQCDKCEIERLEAKLSECESVGLERGQEIDRLESELAEARQEIEAGKRIVDRYNKELNEKCAKLEQADGLLRELLSFTPAQLTREMEQRIKGDESESTWKYNLFTRARAHLAGQPVEGKCDN